MTKAAISLQDLRRSLYVKGMVNQLGVLGIVRLYVHVCKTETLQEAYQMARRSDGALGIDAVTFKVIEESGVERFLCQIRDELATHIYPSTHAGRKKGDSEGRGKESAPWRFRRLRTHFCGSGVGYTASGVSFISGLLRSCVW